MTIIIVTKVQDRYRGFLRSVMLEVDAGTFISPNMSAGVRDRIWSTLADWHANLNDGGIVMINHDKTAVGGVKLRMLGSEPKEIVEIDDAYLIRKPISDEA